MKDVVVKRWLKGFWDFVVVWVILNASGTCSGGVALGVLTVFFGFVSVVLFFRGWLGILSSLLLGVPMTLLSGILWACTWVAPVVRRLQSEWTHRWLIGPGRYSREAQEQEAEMILKAWRAEPSVSILNPIRGTIWWRVLDADDSSGTRLLLRPLFDWRLCALVGEDPHTRQPFFMAVPPRISRVEEAMEWLWNLPRGAWWERKSIYET